jgi:hypothetical protein
LMTAGQQRFEFRFRQVLGESNESFGFGQKNLP